MGGSNWVGFGWEEGDEVDKCVEEDVSARKRAAEADGWKDAGQVGVFELKLRGEDRGNSTGSRFRDLLWEEVRLTLKTCSGHFSKPSHSKASFWVCERRSERKTRVSLSSTRPPSQDRRLEARG